MSQPGRGTAALHRRNGVVNQALHEHAAAVSTADHANRSRRLIKCAKDSRHYPGKKTSGAQIVIDSCGRRYNTIRSQESSLQKRQQTISKSMVLVRTKMLNRQT